MKKIFARFARENSIEACVRKLARIVHIFGTRERSERKSFLVTLVGGGNSTPFFSDGGGIPSPFFSKIEKWGGNFQKNPPKINNKFEEKHPKSQKFFARFAREHSIKITFADFLIKYQIFERRHTKSQNNIARKHSIKGKIPKIFS